MSLFSLITLISLQLEIVYRLGRAAEYKDYETGMHVKRMSHYSRRTWQTLRPSSSRFIYRITSDILAIIANFVEVFDE